MLKKKGIKQRIKSKRLLLLYNLVQKIVSKLWIYCLVFGVILFGMLSENGSIVRYKIGEYAEYIIHNNLASIISGLNDMISTHQQSDEIMCRDYYIRMQELEIENLRLRNILNIKNHNYHNPIIGRIISYSTEVGGSKFFVETDKVERIKLLSAVFVEEGLIGRVISKSKNGVWVMTIYDVHSRIPVLTTITNKRAIMYGTGRVGRCTLRYEDKAPITQENVITLQYEDTTPYGINAGTTLSDEEAQNDTSIVQSNVNWMNLKYVMIFELLSS